MECGHCCRGDKQKLKIKNEYIDTLFSKIDSIGSLTVTGGEPCLAMDKLWYIQKALEHYRIDIDNFYMVTNGKYIPRDLSDWIRWMYKTCGNNEISAVEISQDNFHDWIDKDRIHNLQNRLNFHDAWDYKDLIRFRDDPSKYSGNWVINQGRGWGRDIAFYRFTIEGKDIIDGTPYLNCKGNIVNACDLSYKSQDNPENIICHVDKLSIRQFVNYNKRRFPRQRTNRLNIEMYQGNQIDITQQGELITT
jgi:hypothetical protein